MRDSSEEQETGVRSRKKELRRLCVSFVLCPLFPVLTSLFLILTSAFPAQNPSPFEVEKLQGHTAPAFTLKDIDGKTLSLASLRGNVILLNFWATWCPPCKDELPSMDRLNQRLKGKGLVVVGVSMDSSPSKVKDFLKKTPVGFTVLVDDKLATSRAYKVFSVPTTFIIDKGGIIVEKHFGQQDWTKPEMVKAIEALL